MIIFDPGGGEPVQWAVCFSQKASTAWLTRLPVGKFKHVRAFGCVPHINTWVFFDPALNRTTIRIARGDVARQLIGEFVFEATVIQMPALPRASLRPRIFGWCVPATAQLLGLPGGALRGALVPDTLLRQCLANGGMLLADGYPNRAASAAA
jgi:hypothetical protein